MSCTQDCLATCQVPCECDCHQRASATQLQAYKAVAKAAREVHANQMSAGRSRFPGMFELTTALNRLDAALNEGG